MWICTNLGFLSIVDKAKQPGCLVVRARKAEHIEAHFPEAKVQRTPGNDYLYRAEIARETVAELIAEQVRTIDYANFKNSVADRALHGAYAEVWRVMAKLQR